ncbi:MAG: capsule biosynthesis phosphatase [Lentimonas sp.]|jgi:capsule biosynthesis phosphatase
MKRLVFDLDNTITLESRNEYSEAVPNEPLIAKLREYQRDGFEIIIATARNMRTHENNVGKITAKTLPIILDWLKKYDVPYDEIIVGKPWCGQDGFYIDDKSIRPDEFLNLTYAEIRALTVSKSKT